LGHDPKEAERRLEILRFFDKHGLAATRDAFGVSRRTLYRWKATLQAQGENLGLGRQILRPKEAKGA
jgi:predicted DNA-binding transcriptional regulator YafY